MTHTHEFKITGQQLIGLTLIPLTLTGLISNSTVVLATYRIRSLSPSFAFLTGFLASFDLFFNIIYFGYMTPMIVSDLRLFKFYSYQSTFFLMIAYDAAMEIHLIISLNRFFAVFTPVIYRRMFDLQKTQIYAGLSALFTITNITVYSKLVGCSISYNDEIWMLYYDNISQLCLTYAWIIDFFKNLSVATFDALISVITITKVHATRRQIQNSSSQKNKSAAVRKKEMAFVKQTSVQGVLTLLAQGIYFYVPEMVTNKYLGFMLTTFLIATLSTVDGMTALIYNSEIRFWVFRRRIATDNQRSTSIVISLGSREQRSQVTKTL